jgi:hypothetical protein
MADAWDTYIQRQQSGAGSSGGGQPNPLSNIPIFGALFSALGMGSSGGIKPDGRGMYTPSVGQMPVGPPTPINYGAIRSLLNSGALRTGQVNMAQPMPAPEPVADPAPQKPKHPLASLLSLFGG